MVALKDIQGHWCRNWVRRPGMMDHSTEVHWMQCGSSFGKIHVPADRPDVRGATCLADLSTPVLRKLMAAEGGFGEIRMEGETFSWQSEFAAVKSDQTKCLGFDDNGGLVELDIGRDQSALWRRVSKGQDDATYLEAANGAVAMLISVGTRFLFSCWHPRARALNGLAANSCDRVRAQMVFRDITVLGKWQRGIGIAQLATNPLVENLPILKREANRIIWQNVGFFGDAEECQLSPATELIAVA